MRLSRYILVIVLTRILAAAAILMAILQILDLLDVTTDILERGLGVSGVFYHATLRLPRLFEQVAPLAVLAGGLFAFGQLAREHAVTAMRAAGISVYRMLAMALPGAVCVMLVHFVAVEVIAPRADAALESWWTASEPGKPTDTTARPFRSGGEIVVARPGDTGGGRLDQVTIYRRDGAGRLSEQIEAPSAIYDGRSWRLRQPTIIRFGADEATTSTAAELAWRTKLQPDDVRALLSPQQQPSAASARRALAGGGSERPASYYAVRVQRAFAAPVGILVMLLLATPVALGNFRTRDGAVLSAGCLAAGLAFLVADGLLTALGESAALFPVLAAWTAPAVFAAMAGYVLLKMEG